MNKNNFWKKMVFFHLPRDLLTDELLIHLIKPLNFHTTVIIFEEEMYEIVFVINSSIFIRKQISILYRWWGWTSLLSGAVESFRNYTAFILQSYNYDSFVRVTASDPQQKMTVSRSVLSMGHDSCRPTELIYKHWKINWNVDYLLAWFLGEAVPYKNVVDKV